jgi:hypothetical protein
MLFFSLEGRVDEYNTSISNLTYEVTGEGEIASKFSPVSLIFSGAILPHISWLCTQLNHFTKIKIHILIHHLFVG